MTTAPVWFTGMEWGPQLVSHILTLGELLNNASLAAGIGAAAAFMLVMLNDWRRDRRAAKRLIPALLKRLRVLIESRRTGTRDAAKSLGTGNHLRTIGLPFPVGRIERHADRAVDHLTDRQAMALDNLIFWMRECDRLNANYRAALDQIDAASSDFTRGEASMRLQVPGLVQRLGQRYAEEIHLLTKLDALIAAYLAGTLNERGGIPATEATGSEKT